MNLSFTTTLSATGGRASARRSTVTLAVALTIVGAAAVCTTADTGQDVKVKEERGVYHVSATFRVPQPREVVTAVLTDYEQVPKFLPGVKKSVVRERAEGRAIVEQEMAGKFMMISRKISLLLEVIETPDRITFKDMSRESFHVYDGGWTMTTDGRYTVVGYTLSARPNFSVPGFVLSKLLKRDSARMIEGLRTEMAARASGTVLQ